MKTKPKTRSKTPKKLRFSNRFWSTKPLLFIGFFAFVGSVFLVKSFAASSFVFTANNLDTPNSTGATVIKDSSSPTKGNSNVVQLKNTTGSTSAKAAFMSLESKLDTGAYRVCLLSISKIGVVGGSLHVVHYVDAKPSSVISSATFSQSVNSDYTQTVCTSFNNYTPDALIASVVYNTTTSSTLRIGNILIEKTGELPTSSLRPDSRGFAPYAYVPWGDVSMTTVKNTVGIKNFTAAFVLNTGSCIPAWDGNSTLKLSSSRASIIKTDIDNIRGAGGDVTVSFGGAGGTELALACPSVTTLKDAYKSVIDKYSLTRVDFDIEGSAITNNGANDLRAQAIAALQQEYPNLKVFITLSVNGNGIPPSGVNFLVQLKNRAVNLAGINIMTMDYGVRSTQMGQLAIQSANASQNQIKFIFGASDELSWRILNLTAMIGINDTQPETFSLANAQELRDFADQKKVGALSFWSINRDKSCSGNAATLSDTCSGVAQSSYQYSSILNMPRN